MTKLTALTFDDEWTNTDVDYLFIPDIMNLDEQKELWRKWYIDEYYPLPYADKKLKYVNFVQWLINNGAQRATDNDIVVYKYK